jgi:hypothetical protein
MEVAGLGERAVRSGLVGDHVTQPGRLVIRGQPNQPDQRWSRTPSTQIS